MALENESCWHQRRHGFCRSSTFGRDVLLLLQLLLLLCLLTSICSLPVLTDRETLVGLVFNFTTDVLLSVSVKESWILVNIIRTYLDAATPRSRVATCLTGLTRCSFASLRFLFNRFIVMDDQIIFTTNFVTKTFWTRIVHIRISFRRQKFLCRRPWSVERPPANSPADWCQFSQLKANFKHPLV